jgi:hypothetical protein
MDKQQKKSLLGRIRQWQPKREDYSFASTEMQHCHNCGNDFVGNYCPHCSQKAGVGPINWRSVRQSLMDIWGLGSHSMPLSIWHLMLRPGYLIGDYIDGKRQVSFPPVKMLFFVAVIVALIVYYLLPLLFGGSINIYGGQTSAFEGFDEWNQGHFAWTNLIMALLYILPVWIMFRYSPLRTRHTLPQGFFIQVFLCVLNMVLSYIILLPFWLINYKVYFYISAAVILIYAVITYRQLFGYGVWGTLWRVMIVFGTVLLIMDSLMFLGFNVDFNQLDPKDVSAENSRFYYSGFNMGKGLMILGIGWIINLIATRIARRRIKATSKEKQSSQ